MEDRGLLNIKDDLQSHFTCGSCKIFFKSIGSLHEHLFKHVEEASYSFCGKTRTAFPKCESLDACTQTDLSDLDFGELCFEYTDSFDDSVTDNEDGTKGEMENIDMNLNDVDTKPNGENQHLATVNDLTDDKMLELPLSAFSDAKPREKTKKDKDSGNMVKRGRGRPKKNSVNDKNDSMDDKMLELSAITEAIPRDEMKQDEDLGNKERRGRGRQKKNCESSVNDMIDLRDDKMLEFSAVPHANPRDKTKQDEDSGNEVRRGRGRPKKNSESSVNDKNIKEKNEEESDSEWNPRDIDKIKMGPTKVHRTRNKTNELNESVEPDPETKAKLERLLIRKRATPRDKTKQDETENKIKRPRGRPKVVFESSDLNEENRACMVEYKEFDAEDDKQGENRPKKYVFLRTQVECEYCHKIFKSYYLPYHMKVIHREKEGTVKCDICFKWIVAHQKRNHDRVTHNIQKPPPLPPSMYGLLTYQCEKCGKTVKKTQKHYHEKRHSLDLISDSPLVCDVCGYVCPSMMVFKSHSRKHSKEKYHCNQVNCNFVCISKSELEEHQSRHKPSMPCNICGKLFINKAHIGRHIRSVHMGEKHHQCSGCGKMFYSKYNMRAHYQEQHTDVCYTCSYCSRIFKHRSVFQKHLKTHTGQKNYICHICNHGFIQSTPFWAHMKKKHGTSKEEAVAIRKKHIAEQNERKIAQS